MAPATPSPQPSPPAALDGRTFLSTAVTEDGAARPLVADTRVRLTFEATELSASVGCNHIGGPYEVVDGVLLVGDLSMTAMGCDAARHAQDEWLAAFLAARPAMALDGSELRLEAAGVVIELQDREVANPDRDLVGPTWRLESIVAGDTVSSVPAGVLAGLVFDGQRVSVQSGCNTGGGSYQVIDGAFEFGPIGLTRRGCLGPEGDVERAIIGLLSAGPVAYEIEADVLRLSAGSAGLDFRAD